VTFVVKVVFFFFGCGFAAAVLREAITPRA
jgi:hypothetical protein